MIPTSGASFSNQTASHSLKVMSKRLALMALTCRFGLPDSGGAESEHGPVHRPLYTQRVRLLRPY